MRYVTWSFRILVLLVVAGFLHYTLPARDIVRIVGADVRRVDFGANSLFWSSSGAGDAVSTANRDVFFIDTIRPDGGTSVFRNEDTGWGWPPYFKFDTADLQAEARDLISAEGAPRWVAVRHYGWRNTWFSIFPNALSVKPVAGPDERLIPWFNIVFLTVLALVWVTLWRLWRNFRRRRIDPVIEDIDEGADAARSWLGRLFGRR